MKAVTSSECRVMSGKLPRRISRAEWLAEAEGLFPGMKGRDWKFRCPSCGGVQSGADFLAAGFSLEEVRMRVTFSCIGRWVKGRGCDWTLGGFLPIHKLEVVVEDGSVLPVFEFAGEVGAEVPRVSAEVSAEGGGRGE